MRLRVIKLRLLVPDCVRAGAVDDAEKDFEIEGEIVTEKEVERVSVERLRVTVRLLVPDCVRTVTLEETDSVGVAVGEIERLRVADALRLALIVSESENVVAVDERVAAESVGLSVLERLLVPEKEKAESVETEPVTDLVSAVAVTDMVLRRSQKSPL
jgi:hypothetical protein